MPYQLDRSTLPAVWRDQGAADIMPDAVGSGEITDAIGRQLVLCAKKRFNAARGAGAGGDYTRMVVQESELKGLCFVAADEIAQFLDAQGEKAKAVRVRPSSGTGGDHYFTVVNNGHAGNSVIVDATWRQFPEGTQDRPFCLAGSLAAIRFVLGQNSKMVEMYTAGLTVLGQWDSYECFS